MSTRDERQYIGSKLMPEIKRAFELWAKEYQQERDLGKLGEFANLYRKARKLKTLVWDEKGPVQPNGWRETERTIIMEVIAHGLLMLTDLDKESGDFARWLKEQEQEEDEAWEDEEEEEMTPQGRKAGRITRAERRGREARLLARRKEEGNGIPLATAQPVIQPMRQSGTKED